MPTPHGRLETLQHYHERLSAISRTGSRSYLRLALRLAVLRMKYGRGVDFFGDHGFDKKSFDLVKTYLTPSEHRRQLAEVTPAAFRYLEEDKLAFEERAIRNGLPVCKTEVIITDSGKLIPHAMAPVCRNEEELTRWMHGHSDAEFVLKRPGGGKGYGIFVVRLQRGTLRALHANGEDKAGDGAPIPRPDFDTVGEMFRWLCRLPFKPVLWMLQSRELCHPELKPFMPGPGLGTVRIHTFRMADGTVELKWPLLKMPDLESVTDNFRMGFSGSIVAPIDLERGVLQRGRGRAQSSLPLHDIKQHPVTGATIEGSPMPCWSELLRVATDAARAFTELPALGWDIAITPRGPVIVEANWGFGVEIIQMAYDRGILGEMKDLLARVCSAADTEPSEPSTLHDNAAGAAMA